MCFSLIYGLNLIGEKSAIYPNRIVKGASKVDFCALDMDLERLRVTIDRILGHRIPLGCVLLFRLFPRGN
jgi:hypothetical protein